MMGPEPDDLTPYVAEIFDQLWTELEARVPDLYESSESDRSAIATAISKAAWRGVLRGLVLTEEKVAEATQGKVNIRMWLHGHTEPPDHWAQTYGEGA